MSSVACFNQRLVKFGSQMNMLYERDTYHRLSTPSTLLRLAFHRPPLLQDIRVSNTAIRSHTIHPHPLYRAALHGTRNIVFDN